MLNFIDLFCGGGFFSLGFQKGWTEGISSTQRYKCLGNAVAVPVIQFLGERILEALA